MNNAFENGNNIWNITKTVGTNIIGGAYLGGNYWTNPSGTGYSDTCTDADKDGFCDNSYTVATGNIDYLPLSDEYSHPTIIINNVPNSFPMFSNATYANFTIGEDTIILTLDANASFDGVCNLTDLMGRDVSVAGTRVELNYSPITY